MVLSRQMVLHLASAGTVSNDSLVNEHGNGNSKGNGNSNGNGNGNGKGNSNGNGNGSDIVSFESEEAADTVINIEKIEIENLTIVQGKSQSAEVG
jgi:hypothetical protein